MSTVNLKQFAELCRVSISTASSWCDAGMPCVRSRRRRGAAVTVPTGAALDWVIDRSSRKETVRERLARVKAEKVEMENAKRATELIDARAVDYVLNRIMAAVRSEWNAMAERCASEFAAISDPVRIRERFGEEFRAIGERLSALTGELAAECEREAERLEAQE